MLNRLTVSALLKTVILVTSFCVVVGFSLNAWDSWGRLQMTGRISVITDASANMFKAMHNLRTDRSTTNRLLNGAAPMDSDIEKYLRALRDAEMPAMGNALALLGKIEFEMGEEGRERAIGMGADEYFTKPFSPITLLQTVERVLSSPPPAG